MKFANFRKRLMKIMFREEVKRYEDSIDLLHECIAGMIVKEAKLADDIAELEGLMKLYEEELALKERELRMMNLIVESLKLYDKEN